MSLDSYEKSLRDKVTKEPCKDCEGKGFKIEKDDLGVDHKRFCWTCNGKGLVKIKGGK